MEQGQVTIVPARGKLGVLLPGMGAVSTTVIAGIELMKKGLGRPIGSLTQYGTIRLGKRTDHNSPLIKDFVPLAGLDELVFGCWDIFEDNCYEAALHAGVIEPTRLEAVVRSWRRSSPGRPSSISVMSVVCRDHTSKPGRISTIWPCNSWKTLKCFAASERSRGW